MLEPVFFAALFWLMASCMLGLVSLLFSALVSFLSVKQGFGFANELYVSFYYSIEFGVATKYDKFNWWLYEHFHISGLYFAAWIQFTLAFLLVFPVVRFFSGDFEHTKS